jgi:CBS domain-containing protein
MMASELVKGITIPAPVAISKTDTVLSLGALLSSWDVSSVIVTDKGRVVGAVYGYQLVAYLMGRPNDEVLKRLRQPIGAVMDRLGLFQIPTLSHKERLDSILKRIADNKFGDVALTDDGGHAIGILSLNKIIVCLALRKMKAPMEVRDVASRLKLAGEGQSLSDALRFIMKNRIRRMIIRRNSDYYGLTEREIIKAFFSFQGLQSLSQDEKALQKSNLGQIVDRQSKRLPKVDGDISVHEAWEHLDGDPRGCLIVDDDRIATPWDLAVKPFLEGKLSPLSHQTEPAPRST